MHHQGAVHHSGHAQLVACYAGSPDNTILEPPRRSSPPSFRRSRLWTSTASPKPLRRRLRRRSQEVDPLVVGLGWVLAHCEVQSPEDGFGSTGLS